MTPGYQTLYVLAEEFNNKALSNTVTQYFSQFVIVLLGECEKNGSTVSKEFYGNQGKYQNFYPSVLPYKFGRIFMGMKHFFFKFKMADLKKLKFSKSPILRNFS